MMKNLTIGRVAAEAGVNRETLRYYERIGLIPKPGRTDSGYRSYGPDTVRRLRFIRRAKELGFSLPEIAELLDLRPGGGAACGAVRERARRKIVEVDRKLADLEKIRRRLYELVESCATARGDCPVLDALDEPVGNNEVKDA